MAHRIAVGVSGTGSNLRALHALTSRGALDAEIALVFADRPCAALDWAVELGIETLLVPSAPRGDDAARAREDSILAESVAAVAPELVVLAGYMRITGPAMLAAFAGRMINLHPALLPLFPGAHGVRDALAAGVAGLAAGLHLMSIAEGVETPDQLEILRAQGWSHGQGYLFGRPQEVPAAAPLFTRLAPS